LPPINYPLLFSVRYRYYRTRVPKSGVKILVKAGKPLIHVYEGSDDEEYAFLDASHASQTWVKKKQEA